MNKKFITSLVVTSIFLFPLLAVAYTLDPGGIPNSTTSLKAVDIAGDMLEILWPISVAVVIVMFVLAGFKFMTSRGDPSKARDALNFVIFGLAGVVVILMAWSIVAIVRDQIGHGI